MVKGGKRSGAGRKPGSRDKKPRIVKKKAVSSKKIDSAIDKYEDVTKPLYLNINKYISAKNRKLYKDLQTEYKTPLESLKALRNDLQVRYNFSRIAEMEGVETAKAIAEFELKELTEKGTIDGKKIKKEDKDKKLIQIKGQIESKYPKLSATITSLATELRQLNELIDRIESNREDLTVNIYNILQGKGDKKETKKLTNRIFTLPEDVEDGEIVNE